MMMTAMMTMIMMTAMMMTMMMAMMTMIMMTVPMPIMWMGATCHLVFQMVRIGIGWIGWMMKVCTFREPDYILMAVAMMSDDDEIECDDEVQITIVTHSE